MIASGMKIAARRAAVATRPAGVVRAVAATETVRPIAMLKEALISSGCGAAVWAVGGGDGRPNSIMDMGHYGCAAPWRDRPYPARRKVCQAQIAAAASAPNRTADPMISTRNRKLRARMRIARGR